MRKVDADHMKQRIDTPNNEQERIIAEALVKFIDSEQDCQDDIIQWLPTKREKRTRDCHSVSYGVECSKCRHFESEATRYCSLCGGKYDGVISIKNLSRHENYQDVSGRVRRIKRWHE